MSNKPIDITAFDGTRLDETISDDIIMVSLDGYNIVREDRSRNSAGVCIYFPIALSTTK